MSTVTDFHSHILPGVDDGSISVDESIAMLQMEARQGIRRVIATPHFYPQHDNLEKFLNRRAASEMRLREELERERAGLSFIKLNASTYLLYTSHTARQANSPSGHGEFRQ